MIYTKNSKPDVCQVNNTHMISIRLDEYRALIKESAVLSAINDYVMNCKHKAAYLNDDVLYSLLGGYENG